MAQLSWLDEAATMTSIGLATALAARGRGRRVEDLVGQDRGEFIRTRPQREPQPHLGRRLSASAVVTPTATSRASSAVPCPPSSLIFSILRSWCNSDWPSLTGHRQSSLTATPGRRVDLTELHSGQLGTARLRLPGVSPWPRSIVTRLRLCGATATSTTAPGRIPEAQMEQLVS